MNSIRRYFAGLVCIGFVFACAQAARAADDASGDVAAAARANGKVDFAARLARARVGPDDTVIVLVHSAKDCVFCQRWKGSLGGRGELEQYVGAHPGVQFHIVERPTIAESEARGLYPESLVWLYDKRDDKGRKRAAVPSYDVIVRHKVVWHALGYSAWDKTVFPAIRDLDARRGR
ncbi:hypothetical protein [Castellaniella sp.]|uniref:hypothetical protein n=1 Tax=Castellaniella sp. TaxID=1955812 RepID=UPI003C711F34